jgi:hypothetical protein
MCPNFHLACRRLAKITGCGKFIPNGPILTSCLHSQEYYNDSDLSLHGGFFYLEASANI